VRLTLAASVVIAVTLCAAAVLLVWIVQRGLYGAVDGTAKERARDAARLPVTDGVLPTSAEADNVVQIVDATGGVVASTPNVVGEKRLFTFAAGRAVTVRSVHHVAVPDAADSYRVAAAGAADGRTVYAAVPDDDQQEAVNRLLVAVAGGAPALLAVLVVVTWVLVGRALRPVEVASRRQRQFVADAAHELRSPLAALRVELEVDAASPGALASVDRVTQLADDLLQLARLDDGARLVRRMLDLDDLVFAETSRVRASAPVAVDVSGVSAAQVDGDPAALSRLVRNLLDNAVQHAKSSVAVSLTTTDSTAVLTVADDGPGVPAADRVRIFERFTRLEAARARHTGGAGLGLAIVRDVAAAHGGSVEVAESASGAVFVVRLPASPATPRRAARPDARPAQSRVRP
jgi:signal transduction histidine kinase